MNLDQVELRYNDNIPAIICLISRGMPMGIVNIEYYKLVSGILAPGHKMHVYR